MGWWAANWGNVASVAGLVVSVVGTGITIYFAAGAKTAAKAAEEASKSAKSRVSAVDWSIEFNELIADVEELLSHVGNETNWHRVSTDCTRIRRRAAVANSSRFAFFDEETKKKLRESATQFALLARKADQYAGSQASPKDIAKARDALSEQLVLFQSALTI